MLHVAQHARGWLNVSAQGLGRRPQDKAPRLHPNTLLQKADGIRRRRRAKHAYPYFTLGMTSKSHRRAIEAMRLPWRPSPRSTMADLASPRPPLHHLVHGTVAAARGKTRLARHRLLKAADATGDKYLMTWKAQFRWSASLRKGQRGSCRFFFNLRRYTSTCRPSTRNQVGCLLARTKGVQSEGSFSVLRLPGTRQARVRCRTPRRT